MVVGGGGGGVVAKITSVVFNRNLVLHGNLQREHALSMTVHLFVQQSD